MSANAPSRGTAIEVSERLFGAPTRKVLNPLTNLVGTTATPILANNPERVGWIIQNRSAVPIGIGFGANTTLADFFTLDANGGILTAKIIEDGELVIDPVFAIASVAGSEIFVVEIERV